MLKIDQYQPLREVVFENIRSAIQSGELRPGERLMEVQPTKSRRLRIAWKPLFPI